MHSKDLRPSVLVLAKYYYPYNGGIENSTRVFCEGMTQESSVRVIAFNHEGGFSREIINGVTITRHRVQATFKSQPISIGYLFDAIRARSDIVHFHAPNVIASLAIVLRRPSRLVSIHHMDIYGRRRLRSIARFLYKAVLQRSNVLVVTSLKNAAVSSDITVNLPTRAVPLGINPASYDLSATARSEATRWRRSIVGDAPLIGFVGRHARYKGLDVMLRGLVSLPDVHAVVAGDGPYRQEAEALTRALGIADRVHFLGEISHADKLQLLAAIDVFAFPSTEITEAFGISQLEAMMLGAAVVASNLPTGVTDVAVHQKTALTVAPGNVHEFSVAVKKLIDDPELRQSLAEQARRHVLQEFTNDLMITRITELNRAILRGTLTNPGNPH